MTKVFKMIKAKSRRRSIVYIVLTALAFAVLFSWAEAKAPGASEKDGAEKKEPREILIKTPGLMFDQVRFKVDPEETVRITLENIDEMSHNMVITRPGAREKVVALALQLLNEREQNDFVPETDLVLEYIPLLEPGEKKSILFKAPEKEGVYPYVCTFPGHGAIMYGAIYVTKGAMPDIEEDRNIPPRDLQAQEAHVHGVKLPAMYRTFMPGCGPAGIAVGMEGNVSYCWDAGQCRLRYAWEGGFISLEKNWGSNGSKKAEILGTVFYVDTVISPLRIGTKSHTPEPAFKGYTMIKGYPTFHYQLDGVEVSERITPAGETSGLKRELAFTNLKEPLWLLVSNPDKVQINAGAGAWEGNYYKILPGSGKTAFTMVISDGN